MNGFFADELHWKQDNMIKRLVQRVKDDQKKLKQLSGDLEAQEKYGRDWEAWYENEHKPLASNNTVSRIQGYVENQKLRKRLEECEKDEDLVRMLEEQIYDLEDQHEWDAEEIADLEDEIEHLKSR